jgi:hypothetical protein
MTDCIIWRQILDESGCSSPYWSNRILLLCKNNDIDIILMLSKQGDHVYNMLAPYYWRWMDIRGLHTLEMDGMAQYGFHSVLYTIKVLSPNHVELTDGRILTDNNVSGIQNSTIDMTINGSK